MIWAVIIIVLFICVFFLITRVYTHKDKKPEEAPRAMDESTSETGEADSGQ
jgi:uncharacterized membrane protein